MKGRLLKGLLVVVFATLLSTLGIFASDVMQGIDSNFGNLAGVNRAGVCAEGTVMFKAQSGVLCVDIYEASPGKSCPNQNPTNGIESEKNTQTKDCYAASEAFRRPWTFVSLPQAQRMCAGAGKRLPTSSEWYEIALGTNPESCTVDSGAPGETGNASCVSASGVYDAVGNVWEWVNENIVNDTFDGRTLPEEGYVTSVDASGVPVTSSTTPDMLYGEDYVWSKKEGVFGMIRGGFYGSKSDAGLYTVNASVPTSFASQGVGFRCVEDVL